MAPVPVIQVLSKRNYEDQHLVPLPNAFPLPPLAPESLRISTTILSLTTNNFTYARIGHLLGWWDVHPLPSSIPAEYSDPNVYGRISAWGYGTVLESTLTGPGASEIAVGTQIYGYLPIGTLPLDMRVKVNRNVPGQFLEVSKERSKLMPIYNRGETKPRPGFALPSFVRDWLHDESIVFAWDPTELVQPSMEMDGASDGVKTWKFEDGQIGDDTVMLLFAASGKTGLAFAYELKYGRPAESNPRTVVAVGSGSSRTFTEGTGLFDNVLDYNADSTSDLKAELGLDGKSKIVICDFGARDNAAQRWVEKLKPTYKNTLFMGVGGEVVADSPEKTMEKFLATMNSGKIQINASGLRSQAMKLLGEKRYFEDFLKEWKQCKAGGGFKGLKLVWGSGMGDIEKGWEKLYKGEIGPDEGLVFTLDGETLGKL